VDVGKIACNLVILSQKKLRKAEASTDGDEAEGSVGREVRQRREFKVFQRLRGLEAFLVMRVL
jgi:hypothetical protein